MEVESESEKCRYCLGPSTEAIQENANENHTLEVGEGPLISPCNCKGGQKWCHLSCLRKWQRSVLVEQPTHPAFYEDDERQHVCNVCKSPFSIKPPSRAELMAGFTGQEIASLLDIGCLIIAHPDSSAQMEHVLRHNSHIQEIRCMKHWIQGVFLITEVEPEGASDESDCIVAVNITREFEELPEILKYIFEKAASSLMPTSENSFINNSTIEWLFGKSAIVGEGKGSSLTGANQQHGNDESASATVEVAKRLSFKHFIGGPCLSTNFVCLTFLRKTAGDFVLVAPGSKDCNTGLCVLPLKAGLGGGIVVYGNLKDIALAASKESLANLAEGKEVANLVLVIWGDARWSRTQLLGEIARGGWGMTRGEANNLFPVANDQYNSVTEAEEAEIKRQLTLWSSLHAKEGVIYAPQSEMTDDFSLPPTAEELEEEDREARARAEREAQHREELKRQLLERNNSDKT